MENTLIKLVNPEFTIEFMGHEYRVRKATLDKTLQYQIRLKELLAQKDEGAEIKAVAFCMFLMLKDQIPDLTEEIVFKEIPGDINPLEIMVTLGFLNPSRIKQIQAQSQNQ